MNRRCSAIPTAGPTDPNKTRARLCRWTFDLAANTDRFTQTWLDDIAGEFPRVCDNRVGSPNRHGWYSCANPDQPAAGALSGVMHVDGNGSRLGQYLLPPGDTLSEPAFVARGDDASEGDGWLLSVIWRGRENRSDLAVFNATDVGQRPRGAGRTRTSRAGWYPWQLGGGGMRQRHSEGTAESRGYMIAIPGLRSRDPGCGA